MYGASFRAYIEEELDDMGLYSIAYPNVCMQSAMKTDGKKYYKYLITYVYDTLVISMDPDMETNKL